MSGGTCHGCGYEGPDMVRIRDNATGEHFCNHCFPDEDSPVAKFAKKLAAHKAAGTLDQYPLAERLADLRGEKYVKPN